MTAILIEKENEDQISIQFGYSPDLVAKIRKVDGRKWLPDSKSWIAPNTDQTIQQLLDAFRDEKIFIDVTLCPVSTDINQKNDTKNRVCDDCTQMLLNLDRELKIRGYSPKTRKAYRNHIKAFKLFISEAFTQVNEKQIMDYLIAQGCE